MNRPSGTGFLCRGMACRNVSKGNATLELKERAPWHREGERLEPHVCQEADARATGAMALPPCFHIRGICQDSSRAAWCRIFCY